MKPIWFSLLLAFVSVTNAVGQSGNARYISAFGQSGQVFFFKPKTVPAVGNDMKFEYDMTHVENSDTIILNFSIISKQQKPVTALRIVGDDTTLHPIIFKKLYIELERKKYVTRIQTAFLYKELRKLYEHTTSLSFVTTIKDEDTTFAYSRSAWVKDQRKLTEVFNLVTME